MSTSRDWPLAWIGGLSEFRVHGHAAHRILDVNAVSALSWLLSYLRIWTGGSKMVYEQISSEHKEAVQAFVEKREPDFRK